MPLDRKTWAVAARRIDSFFEDYRALQDSADDIPVPSLLVTQKARIDIHYGVCCRTHARFLPMAYLESGWDWGLGRSRLVVYRPLVTLTPMAQAARWLVPVEEQLGTSREPHYAPWWVDAAFESLHREPLLEALEELCVAAAKKLVESKPTKERRQGARLKVLPFRSRYEPLLPDDDEPSYYTGASAVFSQRCYVTGFAVPVGYTGSEPEVWTFPANRLVWGCFVAEARLGGSSLLITPALLKRTAQAMVAAGESVAQQWAKGYAERLALFLNDPNLPDLVRQNRWGG